MWRPYICIIRTVILNDDEIAMEAQLIPAFYFLFDSKPLTVQQPLRILLGHGASCSGTAPMYPPTLRAIRLSYLQQSSHDLLLMASSGRGRALNLQDTIEPHYTYG